MRFYTTTATWDLMQPPPDPVLPDAGEGYLELVSTVVIAMGLGYRFIWTWHVWPD